MYRATRALRAEGFTVGRVDVIAVEVSDKPGGLARVLAVTFLRPPVGGPNNLYARPLVLVWFMLAPFAAARFARSVGLAPLRDKARASGAAAGPAVRADGSRRGRWTILAAVVCLAATGYALVGVVLEGALFWGAPVENVDAVLWINRNALPGTVVAVHPDDYHSSLGYWSRRPMLLADERHALLFGATAEMFERSSGAVRGALEAGTDAAAARDLDAIGASWLMIRQDRAAGMEFLPSPCFAVHFEGESWLVVGRVAGTCGDGR